MLTLTPDLRDEMVQHLRALDGTRGEVVSEWENGLGVDEIARKLNKDPDYVNLHVRSHQRMREGKLVTTASLALKEARGYKGLLGRDLSPALRDYVVACLQQLQELSPSIRIEPGRLGPMRNQSSLADGSLDITSDAGQGGGDWSHAENEATVSSYLSMLKRELAGEPYSKAEERRRLQTVLDGRSEGAVEFKHQNISAVLMENGWLYIDGYKPAVNTQGSLRIEVERQLREDQVLDRLMRGYLGTPTDPSDAVEFEMTQVDPPDAILDDATQPAAFDDEHLQLVKQVVSAGDVITTLGKAKPNRIGGINRDGLWVHTEKSDRNSTGPQLVPAWMIIAGWHHLRTHGRLSQLQLLNELNVKRSAFVCALLALFPGVDVEVGPKIVLRYSGETATRSDLRLRGTFRNQPDVESKPHPVSPRWSRNSDWVPYTATGRHGKVTVRRFLTAMTHAVDIDGRVCRFHPSRESAQADADKMVASGVDAVVVMAKRYISGEPSLGRPERGRDKKEQVVDEMTASAVDASAPSSRFAELLNHLFDTVHPEDRGPYTPDEVAEALQDDGIPLHAKSISRLRDGTGGPPAERITHALAFFFNVDPGYLLDGGVDGDPEAANPPATQDHSMQTPIAAKVARGVRAPEEFARPAPTASAANEFSTADLLRVTAGLVEVARYCNDRPNADRDLLDRLISLLSGLGPLLQEALDGEAPAPTHFLEHVVAAWAKASPHESGTESEYFWLVEILDRLLDD